MSSASSTSSYASCELAFRQEIASRLLSGENEGSPERLFVLYQADRCGWGKKPYLAALRLFDRAGTLSPLGRQGLAVSIASGQCKLGMRR